jgi:hypothetical protein
MTAHSLQHARTANAVGLALHRLGTEHGALAAAELLRNPVRYGKLTGRKALMELLGKLARRYAAERNIGYWDALAEVGVAIMTIEERRIHQNLVGTIERVAVFGLAGAERQTGLYRSIDDARANWPFSWKPKFLLKTTMRPQDVLAVKIVGGVPEILPNTQRFPTREPYVAPKS